MTGPTVSAALRDAAARLAASEAAGDTARLDARLLLQHVTGLSHADLIGWPDHELRTDEAGHLDALIARRAGGEPVSQILGEKEFWGLSFKVTRDVLTPRPDSETLVELALEMCREAPPRRILDLGTGTGCLLAALLSEYPQAEGTGVDISAAALGVARENLAALGLAERSRLLEQDFAAPVPGGYDLVIANPPYVPDGDRETLAPAVRDHEPGLALFAGPEGLDAYRALSHIIPKVLARRGIAILEAGAAQADAVSRLMREGFAARSRPVSIMMKRDLAGIDRAVGLVAEG